ncbi:MAG: hypothetical protein ACK4NQ_06630 [Fimbriimonadaceae bacterium]
MGLMDTGPGVVSGRERKGQRGMGFPPGGLWSPDARALLASLGVPCEDAFELYGRAVVVPQTGVLVIGQVRCEASGGEVKLTPRSGSPRLVVAPWPGAEPVIIAPRDLPGEVLRYVPYPEGEPSPSLAGPWTVSATSDRVGIRWQGPRLAAPPPGCSRPMVPGAIEVPPNGQPITLGPDGPTMGGYPLVGVMIRADDEALSRLGPGAVRHWHAITRAEAEELYAENQRHQARWIETVRQGLALRR